MNMIARSLHKAIAALFMISIKISREKGLSLKPLLVGEEIPDHFSKKIAERCLFGHRMYSSRRKLALWSVTCNNYKLIDWWGDRKKLFDHKTDAGEYYDLSVKRLELAKEMRERLDTFKSRVESGAHSTEQTEITLNEKLVNRLRGLGYME